MQTEISFFGVFGHAGAHAALARAHQVLDAEPLGYWVSRPLKERIARHYRETYGVEIRPAQLTLTCGASPALVLALSSACA